MHIKGGSPCEYPHNQPHDAMSAITNVTDLTQGNAQNGIAINGSNSSVGGNAGSESGRRRKNGLSSGPIFRKTCVISSTQVTQTNEHLLCQAFMEHDSHAVAECVSATCRAFFYTNQV